MAAALATTLRGELIAFDLNAKSNGKPFRYRTPSGKGISPAPVVVDGQVSFGLEWHASSGHLVQDGSQTVQVRLRRGWATPRQLWREVQQRIITP
jgi:hypothetical protein